MAAPAALAPEPTEGTAEQRHNLAGINAYRARAGAPPLVLDARLNAFAERGNRQLMADHRPHGHFRGASRAETMFAGDGFAGSAAENQGDPHGWTPMPSVAAQIDDVLAAMWAEGPGGGHYDNMLRSDFRRVGIGLALDPAGRLYLTNDFSR